MGDGRDERSLADGGGAAVEQREGADEMTEQGVVDEERFKKQFPNTLLDTQDHNFKKDFM